MRGSRARVGRRALVTARCAFVALLALLALAFAGGARRAAAHELRPALLSLTEIGLDEYDVAWRVPAEAGLGERPVPLLPGGSQRSHEQARIREGDTTVDRFRVKIPGGLAGQTLGIRFAAGPGSEVLVRIATREGRTISGRIVPGRGDFVVPQTPARLQVGATYLKLGVEHILSGLDHLAFVLGLILLLPAWRALWKTVTAFTLAHSLTLALASLQLLRVPPAPVEAAIALSIVLVAREVWFAMRGEAGQTARRPWPLAFAFGLLHGLGFAGALAEVGLPEADIPLALFSFNAGVELGQLAFVLVVLALGRPLGRLVVGPRAWLRFVPAYGIGGTAAFWCLERVVAFWR